MTFTEINKLHYYLIFCVAGSILCYVLCLIFLNDYLHIAELTFEEILLIFAIFGASWGPLFIWRYIYNKFRIIKRRIWPTDVQKVMKNTKQKLVSRDIYGKSQLANFRESTSNIL